MAAFKSEEMNKSKLKKLGTTFYNKFWQSNDYYPVYKFEKKGNDYYMHTYKDGKWINILIYNTDMILAYLKNNNSLLSTEEMTNEGEFNYE